MREEFEQLKEKLKELYNLSSISEFLGWDQNVYMPRGASSHRGELLALISRYSNEKYKSHELSGLLGKFVDLSNGQITDNQLSDIEKRMAYEAWKDWRDENLLPLEFVERYAKLQVESFCVWEEAKKNGQFSDFAPYLEKTIDMSKEKAGYLNPNKEVYDVLIDEFEPGMTSAQLEPLFDRLKEEIIPLLKKVKASNKTFFEIEKKSWPKEAQMKFMNQVLNDMGFDFERGRMDESEHPFTNGMHPTDVRITTHVYENNLNAVGSAIHEGGHALYEQGLDQSWYGTPVGSANSMAIHESQSRFYETRIGNSKNFWEYYYPILKNDFPQQLNDISKEQFYEAVNKVTAGFIRTEADELTYNLHIIIRYEMEKLMLNSKVKTEDLPGIWNKKYEEYLGITPKNDREGILQDVHWADGLIGYFPSYTLGNIIASQLYEKMLKDLPDMEENIRNGRLESIRTWLHEKIYSKGRAFTPHEIVAQATGKPLSVEPYINYLKDKYTKIYSLDLEKDDKSENSGLNLFRL